MFWTTVFETTVTLEHSVSLAAQMHRTRYESCQTSFTQCNVITVLQCFFNKINIIELSLILPCPKT